MRYFISYIQTAPLFKISYFISNATYYYTFFQVSLLTYGSMHGTQIIKKYKTENVKTGVRVHKIQYI